MILSLLQDESLMTPENLAEGYDIFTGKPTETVTHYGEVHTGDAWEPARKHYCGDVEGNMPIGLIIFGDKTHFDHNGVLCTTPVMFTLTCFNEAARKQAKFWRPISFMPNLDYCVDPNEKKPHKSRDSVEDEHRCIAASLKSLAEIHRRGGIRTQVLGRDVVCKVWIHFVIGDTSGNNRWVGHFNGSGKLKRPYRDCKCPFDHMCLSNPFCVYITRAEYHEAKAKRQKLDTEGKKKKLDKDLSKLDINNAFMDADIPLSDLEHGIYRMVPPEVLHTTQEGITEYILFAFRDMLGKKGKGKKRKHKVNSLHRKLNRALSRNSERDIPRGSDRTSLLKNNKVSAHERRGNLLRLLLLMHTESAHDWIFPYLRSNNVDTEKFIRCLKLYLSMEEWFHCTNEVEEVENARPLIAEVIDMVKEIFPRSEGQGWKLPKTHGLTKIQYYMRLFGSAINFFGGPGECNHKKFVKDPANNTQLRIDSFSSQVAIRCYETMVLEIAHSATVRGAKRMYRLVGAPDTATEDTHDVTLQGKYRVRIGDYDEQGYPSKATASWIKNGKVKGKCDVPTRFFAGLSSYAYKRGRRAAFEATGYACCKCEVDGRDEIFRATPQYYSDESWYDWCIVQFVEESVTRRKRRVVRTESVVNYAACILGIFTISEHIGGDHEPNRPYAVVQISTKPLSMRDLRRDFVSKFELGCDLDEELCVVPVDHGIVHPLCVFRNYGGSNREFFSVLPKRSWGNYFSDAIHSKIEEEFLQNENKRRKKRRRKK